MGLESYSSSIIYNSKASILSRGMLIGEALQMKIMKWKKKRKRKGSAGEEKQEIVNN